MTAFRIVRKGTSVPFVFDRDGESIDGWVCTINVKQSPSETSVITREVEPDTLCNQWEGLLTSADTNTLGLHDYRLIGVLTNATTGEEEQPIIRFRVTSSWAD